MTAYYNEIDPKMAAWLRELIGQGHIADGIVDERSIEDVSPTDVMGHNQCHFFAGIGVWSYALRQAGWPDDRQVWTGSCPCQPFSTAGKGKGIADERHLWPAFQWLIKQCQPECVFGEQVAGRGGQVWIDHAFADLEGENYACGALATLASCVGAPHERRRLYWVANASGKRQQKSWQHQQNAVHCQKNPFRETTRLVDAVRWKTMPFLCRWHDGIAESVGRVCIKGFGNALVAPQAQAFIEAYLEISGNHVAE